MRSPSYYKIVDHDRAWPDLFEEERGRIVPLLGIGVKHVEHIGSTSVPALGAKPILDMMLGVTHPSDVGQYLECLKSIGYEHRGETVPGTLYVRKAQPRRFNLHMTEYEGEFWIEHLLFRDFLRARRDVAQRYEDLKRRLMVTFASDPPAYNAAKAAFIESVVEEARLEKTSPDRS